MKKALIILYSFAYSILAFSQTAGTNGVIAQYSFTGNANDISGNGNNATVNGATLTSDRFGNSNCAYHFDGVSNYIELPIQSFVSLNSYTYSMWVKPGNIPSTINYQIYGIGGSTNTTAGDGYDQAASFTTSGKMIALSYNYGTPLQSYALSNAVSYNVWHHIVIVRSPVEIKLFVDGSLVACNGTCNHNGTASYGNSITKRAILGGKSYLENGYFFYGDMDDLIIYNRALKDSEAVGLNNQQFTGNITNTKTFIEIGPNPVNNKVLKIKGAKNSTMTVSDLLGHELISLPIDHEDQDIVLSDFSSGIYFVRIINYKENLLKKIIIE